MHATLRGGIDPVQLEKAMFSGGSQEFQVSSKDKKIEKMTISGGAKKPMSIFYGSNTGTCEALAQTLANAASGHGYNARVAALDSATDALPRSQPVVIITASYEGEPPDNAARFIQWLGNLKGSEVEGVQYAVFGCGHRKFALSRTFSRANRTCGRSFVIRCCYVGALSLPYCSISRNRCENTSATICESELTT